MKTFFVKIYYFVRLVWVNFYIIPILVLIPLLSILVFVDNLFEEQAKLYLNNINLAKCFLKINNACAFLPLIFFTVVILSFRFRKNKLNKFLFKSLFLFFPVLLIISNLTCLCSNEVIKEWSTFIASLIVSIFLSIYILVYFGVLTHQYLSCFATSLISRTKPRIRSFYKYKDVLANLIENLHHRFYIANSYFIRYISLRYPVVFYVGLIYNMIIYIFLFAFISGSGFIIENPDASKRPLSLIPPPWALFTIWSSSLSMWLFPFIRAWIQIFGTGFIDEYYRNTLSKIISNLDKQCGCDKHRVLLGFGRLGQGVHKELLERRTKEVFIEPLIDPSDGSSIRYLCKDMVIVDKNENLFDHVFTDPALEKIGISKGNYRCMTPQQKNQENCVIIDNKKIWIPAIIGDITNESVKDYSKLKQSEFFIDTIRGYDETLSISEFARKHKKVKGIITVMDSSQKELLFPKHSGEGIFLCHPTHLQGITLGETVYSAMIKPLNKSLVSKPKVLVFTDDMAQTHYMMETILQELKLSGQIGGYFKGENCNLNVSVCSDSPDTKRYCEHKNSDSSNEVSSDTKNDEQVNKFGLDIRIWKQVIERCSNPRYETSNEGSFPARSYIESEIIFEKPRLMTMETIFNDPERKPHIVVVSYKDSAWELRVLHELILAVERYNYGNNHNSPYKPKIIVGFRGEESKEVRDDLQYYELRFPTNENEDENERTRFPSQAIDARVDLNRDPIEHIGAIAEAMSSERKNKINTIDDKVKKKIKDNAEKLCLEDVTPSNDWREELNGAIGIHIIDRNRRGVMPDILQRLAGLNNFHDPPEYYENERAPSFHYCRYQNCTFGMEQGNKFLFTSYATLEKPSKGKQGQNKNGPDIGAMLLSVPSMKPDEKYIEPRRFVVNSIKSMIFGKVKENTESDYEKVLEKCLLQVTCPPESYRRKILNITENKEYFEQVNKLKKLEREKQRFYFDNKFSYKNEQRDNQKSLAKIYLCCRHGDKPGALAIALNNMLFKRLQEEGANSIRNPDKLAFNITYLINYFSYSTNVIYKAIYGNLVDTDCGNELENGVIDHVLICPISDGNNQNNSWQTYAENLKKFLNKEDLNGRDSHYDIVDKGKNILVYRKAEPCAKPKVCKMMIKDGSHSPDIGCDICRKYWAPITELNC